MPHEMKTDEEKKGSHSTSLFLTKYFQTKEQEGSAKTIIADNEGLKEKDALKLKIRSIQTLVFDNECHLRKVAKTATEMTRNWVEVKIKILLREVQLKVMDIRVEEKKMKK